MSQLASTPSRRHAALSKTSQTLEVPAPYATIGIHDPALAQWLDRCLDTITCVGVATSIFILYLATLAPSVIAGDAGELVTAAWELGVPHPPGYPLWCLLTHFWMQLLPGTLDVAWRANSFSAFCGAATCGWVFLIARQMRIRRLPAVVGTLLLGVSQQMWAQSVIAEVYALNAFLFGMGVYCLVRWSIRASESKTIDPKNLWWLVALCVTLGLGLTNHHTFGVLGPFALAWIVWIQWRVLLQWRCVLLGLLAMVLPLLIYMYLPWSASHHPYVDWGHPVTWSAMKDHILRAQYKEHYTSAIRDITSVFFQFTVLVRYFLQQFSPVVGLLLLLSILARLFAPRKFTGENVREQNFRGSYFRDFRDFRGRGFRGLMVMMVGIWLLFGWLLDTRPEHQEIEANAVFFIPVYFLAAIGAAGGIEFVLERMRQWTYFIRHPQHYIKAALVVALLPVGVCFAYQLPDNNYSHDWYATDHARNLMNMMEPNAVIFPSGDHNTFPLIYLHRVEGGRPDLIIADKYGYVEARDFPELTRRITAETKESPPLRLPREQVIAYLLSETSRPVYFTMKTNLPELPGGAGVQQVQVGMLFRAAKTPPAKPPASYWADYHYRNDLGKDPSDYGDLNIVSDYFFFRGLSLLEAGKRPEAVAALDRAARLLPGVKEVANNIGSALAEQGMLDLANRYYQQALSLDDDYVNAHWNMARTDKTTGHPDQAIAHFEKLQKLTPEDFRVPGELGFLYLRTGRTQQAVEDFRRSLKLNATQPQITQVMSELAATGPDGLFQPVLQSSQKEIRLGAVILDTDAEQQVTITNTGDKPLKIVEVHADCDCTKGQVASSELKVGESTSLTIRFHETRHLGKQQRMLTIRPEAGPPLRIPIDVDVVAAYATDPEKIDLEELLPGAKQTIPLAVRSRLNKPFTIQQITCDLPEIPPPPPEVKTLATESPVPRENEHKIELQITAGQQAGERNGHLHLELRGEKTQSIDIPVRLRVREVVRLEPRSLFLRDLDRKAPFTTSVKLNLPKGWKTKVTQITSSAPWLTPGSDTPGMLQADNTLTLQLDTAHMPDTFSGSLAIQTDHPNLPPIVIPVYGFFKTP